MLKLICLCVFSTLILLNNHYAFCAPHITFLDDRVKDQIEKSETYLGRFPVRAWSKHEIRAEGIMLSNHAILLLDLARQPIPIVLQDGYTKILFQYSGLMSFSQMLLSKRPGLFEAIKEHWRENYLREVFTTELGMRLKENPTRTTCADKFNLSLE